MCGHKSTLLPKCAMCQAALELICPDCRETSVATTYCLHCASPKMGFSSDKTYFSEKYLEMAAAVGEMEAELAYVPTNLEEPPKETPTPTPHVEPKTTFTCKIAEAPSCRNWARGRCVEGCHYLHDAPPINPAPKRRRYDCFTCGGWGHYSRDCPAL